MTPAQWIIVLAEKDIIISERTLREKAREIRRHVVGDEPTQTFSDAIIMYNASAKTAKQLIPILQEIGSQPLSTINGAMLKSLGPKMKPMASTDTWWREIVTPARAVINNAHELKGTPLTHAHLCPCGD